MFYHELSAAEIQARGLDLLDLFDRVCGENHLTYFLSGGTLLGAVRHKGFIPWDDDTDVMMPRGDFLKFQELIGGYLGDRYGYGSVYVDEEYRRPWARLWDKETKMVNFSIYDDQTAHIFLDVFPIDGVPTGKFATVLFFRMMRVLDASCKMSKRKFLHMTERMGAFKLAIHPLFHKIGGHWFAMQMQRLAMKFPFGKTKYAGVSMTIKYGAREKLPYEVFASAVEVEFCGRKLPAPVGWKQYLTALYGDYMQLPPVEKRDEHHFRFHVPVADKQ